MVGLRRGNHRINQHQPREAVWLIGGSLDQSMGAHAVTDAGQAFQIECCRAGCQIAAERCPSGDLGLRAAAVAPLVHRNDMPGRQPPNRLIPHAGMKSGGMDHEQRWCAAAQLRSPFMADHRDVMDRDSVQERYGQGRFSH